VSQIKQPAIQVVANEINSIDTESNIPAIKAMVDLDRRIRESILEKKYDKIKEQTIKQEEAENINADSIRKDMNREFID
jgi:ribosomal protein S4